MSVTVRDSRIMPLAFNDMGPAIFTVSQEE